MNLNEYILKRGYKNVVDALNQLGKDGFNELKKDFCNYVPEEKLKVHREKVNKEPNKKHIELYKEKFPMFFQCFKRDITEKTNYSINFFYRHLKKGNLNVCVKNGIVTIKHDFNNGLEAVKVENKKVYVAKVKRHKCRRFQRYKDNNPNLVECNLYETLKVVGFEVKELFDWRLKGFLNFKVKGEKITISYD